MPPHLIPLTSYIEYPPEEMRARAAEFRVEMQRRRSLRSFSERPVPREVLEDCLRAAGSAPSGANLQPWHFVVVSDPELKSQIRAGAEYLQSLFLEGVDYALYKRDFRAYYGKIDRTSFCKFKETFDVVGLYIDELCNFGYTAVAWRAVKLRAFGALRYLPAKSMFPSAGTDHKYIHPTPSFISFIIAAMLYTVS